MKNVEQKNLVSISIDKVSFQLQEDHDFLWLKDLGDVFCVFDQQDSGNISFGLENNNKKVFCEICWSQTGGLFW